jgi:tetratricopeptide (TPR) repeat protein
MRLWRLAVLLVVVLDPGGIASTGRVARAQEREQPDAGPPAGEATEARRGARPGAPAAPAPAESSPDEASDEAPQDAIDASETSGAGAASDPDETSGTDEAKAGDMDEAGDPDQPRPWADGVPIERQDKARAIYAGANELLHEYLLEEAVDKYREALDHWQHPAIHYNLARALDSLGRPLEAYAHMEKALRYGEAAFAGREYAQVLNFQRLLDQKLAEVVIVCEEEGVDIALDGKQLFTGPGTVKERVLPGEHLIVAHKPRQALLTRQLTLRAGRRTTIALETRQRWTSWAPWLVAGTGALVGITGGLLQRRAQDNMHRYREAFLMQCTQGCTDDDKAGLTALRQRALWQSRFGVAAMITGGGALVTGTILVVFNQSRSFRINLDRSTAVSVTPLLTPETAGLAIELAF